MSSKIKPPTPADKKLSKKHVKETSKLLKKKIKDHVKLAKKTTDAKSKQYNQSHAKAHKKELAELKEYSKGK